jgi:Domain of unknown function (DUF4129)
MDLREAAAANGRLAGVALLTGLAVLGLGSRPVEASSGPTSLTVLIGLALPCALLTILAAMRLPRSRTGKTGAVRPRLPLRWGFTTLVLLGMLLLAVTAAALTTRLTGKTLTVTGQASPPTAPSAAAPTPSAASDPRWLTLAIGMLLTLLVVAAFAVRRRAGTNQTPPAATEPAAPSVPAHRTPSAVVGRRATPRTAIIRCYAAMEGALATVPAVAPHAADSPSEVLDRALAAKALRSPEVWRLVELFDEARFSPHRMTEPERQEAEAALQLVLDELRSGR